MRVLLPVASSLYRSIRWSRWIERYKHNVDFNEICGIVMVEVY